MMKKRLSKLLFIIILLLPISLSAQELSEQQKNVLQKRTKDKVDEFQHYMKQLADKRSTSTTVKNNAYSLALKLFIGEGESYTTVDPYTGESQMKPAVRMETSSKYRSTKSRTRMKLYLENLKNSQTYTQIEITDADVVRVDNIQRVGDHYECMAYFCQKYIGYRDNRIVYQDITTKKIRVYIQAIRVPNSDGSTTVIWNALLGDIYVVETH